MSTSTYTIRWQVVENTSQVDVLLGMLPARAGILALDWAMTEKDLGVRV